MRYHIAIYDARDKLIDHLLAIGIDERDAMISAAWCQVEAVRVEWREAATDNWSQTTLPFGLKRS